MNPGGDTGGDTGGDAPMGGCALKPLHRNHRVMCESKRLTAAHKALGVHRLCCSCQAHSAAVRHSADDMHRLLR
eukprot:946972-Prymnesium_polylepis.1